MEIYLQICSPSPTFNTKICGDLHTITPSRRSSQEQYHSLSLN